MKHKYAKLRVEQFEDRNCPAPFTLPNNVIAGGYTWKLANNTFAIPPGTGLGIRDATKVGGTITDAFDGAFLFRTNSVLFKDPFGTVDLTGTTLTTNFLGTNGLIASIQYFFVPNASVVRAMAIYTNPTDSPITITVQCENDLGTDGTTTLNATSDGNGTLDPGDRWFITDGQATDPTKVFVRAGAGLIRSAPTALRIPSVPNSGVVDKYVDQYTVFVPPGGTRSVMLFGQLFDNVAAAQASAPVFDSLGTMRLAHLLDGLSDTQLAQVVNWNLPPVNVSIAKTFAGKERAGFADLNHDGATDVVLGSSNGQVTLVNGATGDSSSFFPFGSSFVGAVSVAVGDFNRDGVTDFFAAGKNQVKVFTGLQHAKLTSFTVATSTDLRVAAGDVNGDGVLDIVVSEKRAGMATQVEIFSGLTHARIAKFLPYGNSQTGTVLVALADLNHDGQADILTLSPSRLLRGFRSFDRLKLLERAVDAALSGVIMTPL